jgi:hypothetical protein
MTGTLVDGLSKKKGPGPRGRSAPLYKSGISKGERGRSIGGPVYAAKADCKDR